MASLREQWQDLRTSRPAQGGSGYHLQLLETCSDVRLYAALAEPGLLPAVVVEIPEAARPRKPVHISTKAFEAVVAEFAGLPSGRLGIAVQLRDMSYEDLFSLLCEDMLASVRQSGSPAEAVRSIVRCIERWRRFLDRNSRTLSDEQVQGLIGELVVLARCVAGFGPRVAVSAWTILSSPERFLPYNNGLSATASAVDLEEIAGGLAKIRAVRDLQIVNGGQTTASVASCLRRDGADLGAVLVPLKLSIVPAAKVDELVPLISKCANTQNRIQEADFSANHPWHIELEKLSRATWTQPTPASPRGTRWFYERSRGQYADDLGAQATPAGRRRFRAENPGAQKITKTDLAKYILSWDQRPAVVSRGAQKCFMEYMNQISRESRPKPDTEEFRRIVGQAILFHTAERLYGELKFQGLRAQVVTYSIARLSHVLQRRMCWDTIWEQQSLPESLIAPLKVILIGVRDVVLHPSVTKNPAEWSKREECWASVLRLDLDLPGLADAGRGSTLERPTPTAVEGIMIEAVKWVPADVWFAASKWAKETQSLEAWQRSIAYSVGGLLARALAPSPKQAKQACREIVSKPVEIDERGGILHK